METSAEPTQHDVLPFTPFLIFQSKIYVPYEEVWNPQAVLVDQTVEILGRPALRFLVLGTGSIYKQEMANQQ